MLELSVYDGIPHLLTPVITDMKEASSGLRWCVNEMENIRYYGEMTAVIPFDHTSARGKFSCFDVGSTDAIFIQMIVKSHIENIL